MAILAIVDMKELDQGRDEETPVAGSAFDLPFTPASAYDNRTRYLSALIEPYDMPLLQADYLKMLFGLPVAELPHYSRMASESRSCVYDFEDGVRLIVVPELWPTGEGAQRSVIRASGYDHLAVVAEDGQWAPDAEFAAKIGQRFAQISGIPFDRLMFAGLTPLGLPCWIVENEETVQ